MPNISELSNRYHYLNVVVVMFCAGLVSFLLDSWLLPKLGTLLILQLGVVTVALSGERLPAIIAALLGALIFNFFFTDPRYSLHMIDAEDIVNMLVFLFVGMVTCQLATFYRSQGEELRQAQLRSSILLSVSHDLRTPLSTIIGTLSTIQAYKDKLSSEQNVELLQAALDESHRLHSYIENLLQATKLQHGEIQLVTTLQSIDPIIDAVDKRFEDPRIHINLAENLPHIYARASLLEQALYNLVDNALKYSGQDTPVQIDVQVQAPWLEIFIRDQGPGIPKALHKKVFQLFYSTRHGDTGEGGTGLGLVVTAGIVKAHRGLLDIIPSPEGCTMRVRLPLAKKEK